MACLLLEIDVVSAMVMIFDFALAAEAILLDTKWERKTARNATKRIATGAADIYRQILMLMKATVIADRFYQF